MGSLPIRGWQSFNRLVDCMNVFNLAQRDEIDYILECNWDLKANRVELKKLLQVTKSGLN